ncbi:MAG: hypothetical protein ABW321_01640 [Polyangiales bacterium]
MLDAGSWFAYAVFKDNLRATGAVHALLEGHFTSDAVGVLLVHEEEVEELLLQHKTAVPRGIALGMILGAAMGAVTMSSIGVLAVGVTPVLLAWQGAAAGGAMGSLGGALGGLGFWRDEIDFPAHAFTQGTVLVGVVTNVERLDHARRVLTGAGAEDTHVSTRAEAGQRARELTEYRRRPSMTGAAPKQA